MKRFAAAGALLVLLALVPVGVRGAPARAAQADPCAPAKIAKPKASLATPARLSVSPGEHPIALASVDLAARPTPIDVFFVLDSSPSMDAVFDSLKESIVTAGDDLRASGIDIHAGVADFSDLNNRPYRLDSQLAVIDCRIAHALDAVQVGGGGQEPHRLALEQAVAGTGRWQVGLHPGQGAAWRPGTLRLVMHATDTGIDESIQFSPNHEGLIAMFLDRDVHHVGIHVVNDALGDPTNRGEENSNRARPDLERLSRDTRTLAPALPALGLDCNGDQVPDVLPSQPVVCQFHWGVTGRVVRASMGTIVRQVVQTLRSTTGVQLAVADSGGLPVTIDRPFRQADLADPTSLEYRFSVSCPPNLMGHDVPVRFQARIAGDAVADSTTLVTCVAAPVAAAAAPPLVGVAAAQAPVPSAVAPSSALQGAGQATLPAGAPANAPAFGMAVAPEDQIQVARAGISTTVDHGRATRVAGAVMAIGAAAALRRRTSLARQHRR